MKDRTVWALLVILALVAGGIYLWRHRSPGGPAVPASVAGPSPAATSAAPPATPPGPETPMVQLGRGGPKVPVQDGKTLDLSSGRPVVRDDAGSKAALDKAAKEMAEAASEVTFAPQPAAKKKAEPAPKP